MDTNSILLKIDSDKMTWKKFLPLLLVSFATHWILALFYVNFLASEPPSGPWPEATQSYAFLIIIDHEPKRHPERNWTTIAETHYYYTNHFNITNGETLLLENPEVIIERRITPGRLVVIKTPLLHTIPLSVAIPKTTAAIAIIEHPSRNWKRVPLDPLAQLFLSEPSQ